MAKKGDGPVIVGHGQAGKGDKRRPHQIKDAQLEQNGVNTFGDDWAIPPVIRRKRQQEQSRGE